MHNRFGNTWKCGAITLVVAAANFGGSYDAHAGFIFGNAAEPAVHYEDRGNNQLDVSKATIDRNLEIDAPSGSGSSEAVRAYGRLPLRFESNRGQAGPQVKFLARGPGYTVLLTASEADVLLSPQRSGRPHHEPRSQDRISNPPDKTPADEASGAALRIKLNGANVAPDVAGLDPLPGRVNYFIGNDPGNWRTDIPTYSKVRYERVYPGVDLIYYGQRDRLEYDFVLMPGADPKVIALAIDGARDVRIDERGDLVLQTASGEARFHSPVVYQPNVADPTQPPSASSGRTPVDGHYIVNEDRTVGFALGAYDASKPLVIDPVLSYSTYLAGTVTEVCGGGRCNPSNQEGTGVGIDLAGSAYIVGNTDAIDFPRTVSGSLGHHCGIGNLATVFVTKLDPHASGAASLVYSTYLGGNSCQSGAGIAVDGAGNAYVTGFTKSSNFPTMNAYQSALNGGLNAYVAKLGLTGALSYSTYFGPNPTFGRSIAVDLSGKVYVTGSAGSNPTPFPTTSGAFPGSCTNSAFVAKFDATLVGVSSLLYSACLGGNSNAGGIAADPGGNVYVTGTAPNAFPTTAGAAQSSCGGTSCAYVAKLNLAGTGNGDLVYSTHLGGGREQGGKIAVDASGNAYAVGETTSSAFPVTPGAFQTSCIATGTGVCAQLPWVAKLNPSASGAASLVYATYLGGSSGDDSAEGVGVDSHGNVYVTGFTASADFPVTPNAPYPTCVGCPLFVETAFVAQLIPDVTAANQLAFSTFLAGHEDPTFGGGDDGLAIAVDPPGNMYVTGTTGDEVFPTTPSAFQAAPAPGSGNNVFFTVLSKNTPTGAAVVVRPLEFLKTPVTLTFSTVTQTGETTLETSSVGPAPPTGFKLGSPPMYYELATTAGFTGTITVCISYAGIAFGGTPTIFHFEGGAWRDVTTSVNAVTKTICGVVTSLSPFALFEPTGGGGGTANVTIGPVSMEGDLRLNPSAQPDGKLWVAGGYTFTIPGSHLATTLSFSGATVSLPVRCTSNGPRLAGGDILVPLADKTFAVAANDTRWFPLDPVTGNSADQANPVTFQGAVEVSAADVTARCGAGATMLFLNYGGDFGAVFSAKVSSSASPIKFNAKFHYRAPAGEGKVDTNCSNALDPNAGRSDVCGAGWSSTKSFSF